MNRRQFIQTTLCTAAATGLAVPASALSPENKIVLDLDPSPEYPRLSEGAFTTGSTR